MSRVDYREGDWFAIPLREGGFGLGLIARAAPKHGGVLIGYFFGPKFDQMPTLTQAASYMPNDASLIRRFGHLAIRQGEWPIVGRYGSWDRARWPMPAFVRRPAFGPPMLVEYNDNDPSQIANSVVLRPHSDHNQEVPEAMFPPRSIVETLDTILTA